MIVAILLTLYCTGRFLDLIVCDNIKIHMSLTYDLNKLRNEVSIDNPEYEHLALGICIGYLTLKEVRLMLNADIDETKKHIDNLLIIACYKGSDSIIMEILAHNPNINTMSVHKSTPIMYLAERYNMYDTTKYIVENFNVNMLLCDENGNSVLYYVRRYHEPDEEIVKYINEQYVIASINKEQNNEQNEKNKLNNLNANIMQLNTELTELKLFVTESEETKKKLTVTCETQKIHIETLEAKVTQLEAIIKNNVIICEN